MLKTTAYLWFVDLKQGGTDINYAKRSELRRRVVTLEI